MIANYVLSLNEEVSPEEVDASDEERMIDEAIEESLRAEEEQERMIDEAIEESLRAEEKRMNDMAAELALNEN